MPASVSPSVPSPASTDELAERLHREIEELQANLTDDLLLSLILLGEDEVDGAIGLLDDGSDRLHRFQDRIEDAVADAAVQRDAEAVVAAASTAPEPSLTRPGSAFRIRVLASAAAAVLAAVVALVSVEPSGSPNLVAARSSSSAPAEEPVQTSSDLAHDAAGQEAAPAAREGQVSPSATTPSDRLQVLRVIGDQGGILARLGSEPRRSAVAALFGVERLLGQVVADVASVLPSETVATVTETLSDIEVPGDRSSSDTQPETTRPEPDPSSAEAPSEQPSGTSTEEPPTDGSGTDSGTDSGTESETTSDADSDTDPEPGSDEPTSEEPTSEESSDDTSGSLPADTSGSWSAPLVEGTELL